MLQLNTVQYVYDVLTENLPAKLILCNEKPANKINKTHTSIRKETDKPRKKKFIFSIIGIHKNICYLAQIYIRRPLLGPLNYGPTLFWEFIVLSLTKGYEIYIYKMVVLILITVILKIGVSREYHYSSEEKKTETDTQ